ncbi:MAG: hypothetical protein AAF512_11850 [Pseudomonadota bacterium]
MEYKEVSEAKDIAGLRLALIKGIPGPWGESARSIFELKNIDYIPVAQYANQPNEELKAWTGFRNAPVAVYNDERARAHWYEILMLAERLEPNPSLIPGDINGRMVMFGLCNEICGEGGMTWEARMMMMDAGYKAQGEDYLKTPMPQEYGYSPEKAKTASIRVNAVLRALAVQLKQQKAAGKEYFIADELSALDIYWAHFSQLFEPLPADVFPIPDILRKTWGTVLPLLEEPVDSALMAHRNMMFERHLGLPRFF